MIPAVLMAALMPIVGPNLPDPAPVPPAPEGVESVPWTELEVTDCKAQLEAAGVSDYSFLRKDKVRKVKVRRRRGEPEPPKLFCHVPQRLRYRKGPGEIRYTGYLIINCKMALALARWEKIVQEEAKRIFGEKRTVRTIVDYGTYNCRRIRGTYELSQHSYGNAIDIARFYVRGYGKVDVEKDWVPRLPWRQPASDFLRAVAKRTAESGIFVNVLTPEYDAGHKNHFHFDLDPFPDPEEAEDEGQATREEVTRGQ